MKKTYETRSKKAQTQNIIPNKTRGIKKQRKTRRGRRVYYESDEEDHEGIEEE